MANPWEQYQAPQAAPATVGTGATTAPWETYNAAPPPTTDPAAAAPAWTNIVSDTAKRVFGVGPQPAPSEPGVPGSPAYGPPAPTIGDRYADFLAPAPDTTYGTLPQTWVARDDKTGEIRFAMPTSIRDVLSGNLFSEQTPDPDTGRPRQDITPGANLLLNLGAGAAGGTPKDFAAGRGAGDMRFGGADTFASTVAREPSSTFTGPLPATADELTAAVQRANQPPPPPPAPVALDLRARPQTAQSPLAPQIGPDGTLVPPGSAPDPAIKTPAEIQAVARGYYSSADQAAASNAMLPDANATAVRKLFSDAVPSDPEQARIAANQPAVQAGKNVDATGPMSFDTAMLLDRDLTDRMRASRGQDVHDLSQLQQGLRDQMDQVPDLANLRPARQAYTQYIKQSQMDDINYGASLKNDPAAAGAYVRQRAAALLKNNNAMRNWTPEETAALEQVATSGDIGMLGRLSVSLIKPLIRTVGAGVGHFVGGVPGAFVGAEVGGDIGATQAARLRAYLSKTTLDPVMQQITRGVPPPNVLGPQP